MTTLREAAQMALNALMQSETDPHGQVELSELEDAAIAALRSALAQPEQEPVAWRHWLQVDGERFPQLTLVPRTDKDDPLYAAPPQREWIGLTDEEIDQIRYDIRGKTMGIVFPMTFARAIEAKLKEKNGNL